LEISFLHSGHLTIIYIVSFIPKKSNSLVE